MRYCSAYGLHLGGDLAALLAKPGLQGRDGTMLVQVRFQARSLPKSRFSGIINGTRSIFTVGPAPNGPAVFVLAYDGSLRSCRHSRGFDLLGDPSVNLVFEPTNSPWAKPNRLRKVSFFHAVIDCAAGKPSTGLDGGKSQDCGSHVCVSMGVVETGYPLLRCGKHLHRNCGDQYRNCGTRRIEERVSPPGICGKGCF